MNSPLHYKQNPALDIIFTVMLPVIGGTTVQVSFPGTSKVKALAKLVVQNREAVSEFTGRHAEMMPFKKGVRCVQFDCTILIYTANVCNWKLKLPVCF